VNPYDRAPFVVIWETTRACALACVHCRAEAMPHRDAAELTTDEGRALLDAVRRFGEPAPLVVLTGGDPFRRPDLSAFVAHGTQLGLSVALTPSATGAVTDKRLRALREAGLARLAVSLDGASAEAHDAFRRVRGSHRHTMRILAGARALGLPLQINTTVSRETVDELPALARQVESFGVALWALFFLIPVGRARATQALDAAEIERVLAWAAEQAARVPFGIKTTEAPHYHRVLAQRGYGPRSTAAPAGRAPRAPRAVTDGNGFLFVDHRGEIYPSGFLPVTAGNARHDDLVEVYRTHPLFRALRDPARLRGRCGACEYRERCGGSRARAYAATCDPLAEDPGCAWPPAAAAISGGSDAEPRATAAAGTGTAVTPAAVTEALRAVLDPELGMSVVDLGLVYGIDVSGGEVRITMTLTAAGCPLHDVLSEWARAAVGRVPGVERVEVTLTFDPPWSPDRIVRR
jgi:radical SAM protein